MTCLSFLGTSLNYFYYSMCLDKQLELIVKCTSDIFKNFDKYYRYY